MTHIAGLVSKTPQTSHRATPPSPSLRRERETEVGSWRRRRLENGGLQGRCRTGERRTAKGIRAADGETGIGGDLRDARMHEDICFCLRLYLYPSLDPF